MGPHGTPCVLLCPHEDVIYDFRECIYNLILLIIRIKLVIMLYNDARGIIIFVENCIVSIVYSHPKSDLLTSKISKGGNSTIALTNCKQ